MKDINLSETLIRLFGDQGQVTQRQSVSGGDINEAAVLTLANKQRVFIKENRAGLMEMFVAEANGLKALSKVAEQGNAPPVPKVLTLSADDTQAFLLMEEIPTGRLKSGADFGRSLAALHKDSQGNSPKEESKQKTIRQSSDLSYMAGFDTDNWIGSTPQLNEYTVSWIDFFRERRLLYQWNLLRHNGYGEPASERNFQSLMNKLESRLPDVDDGMPSLLHGDLWGGNWVAGSDGRAWLIDPAVYYGHREADLAMTHLFGGFPTGFHAAYNEAWPLLPGFSERIEIYNLYHLMNHVNLFGNSYWGSVRSILGRSN